MRLFRVPGQIELSHILPREFVGQVTEAAKQISTLSAREDEQRKRRQRAEEESDKIRKVRPDPCYGRHWECTFEPSYSHGRSSSSKRRAAQYLSIRCVLYRILSKRYLAHRIMHCILIFVSPFDCVSGLAYNG